MLSHAIKVKQNGHSKNAFSWRYTLLLLIIIRFKTNMRNIRYINLHETEPTGLGTAKLTPIGFATALPDGRNKLSVTLIN